MKNNAVMIIDEFLKNEKGMITVNFDNDKRLLRANFKSDLRNVNAYETNYDTLFNSLSKAILKNNDVYFENDADDELFTSKLDERLHYNLELRFVYGFGEIHLMSAEPGVGNKFIDGIEDFKTALYRSYSL